VFYLKFKGDGKDKVDRYSDERGNGAYLKERKRQIDEFWELWTKSRKEFDEFLKK